MQAESVEPLEAQMPVPTALTVSSTTNGSLVLANRHGELASKTV